MNTQPLPVIAQAITRTYVLNWWTLKSGRLIQICKLWHCPESGRVIATIRDVINEEGDLSPASFDMSLKNITNYGRRVAR